MEITAPVTDYVRGSLLTTEGDLIQHDGSAAARFPIGGAGQIPRILGSPLSLMYQEPGRYMFEQEYSAKNASGITVLSTGTVLITLDLGTVYTNGRYVVSININITKGGTAGDTIIRVQKDSGTADIICFDNRTMNRYQAVQAANEVWYKSLFTMFKITSGGTLVLNIEAYSAGSDSVVGGEGAQIYTHRVKAN